MRAIRTIIISASTVAVLLFATAVPSALAADPGDAGALFLRIGMGARASAMGEGFIAVAEDASAVYWNPAAMAAVLGTHVMLMHNEYLQSVRLEQAALTHETKWGTVGLGFTGLYMDKLERRLDSPSESPLGEFGVNDVSATVSFARYVVPNAAVGIAVKPVMQRIDEESANGVAVDVGVYHISRVEGVKMAAVITNLGLPMKFDAEEYALPRTVKVGASYERESVALKGRVLLTLDVVFPNDGDIKEHLGGEYAYNRLLYLRAGYKAGYDSQGGTFGFGVRHQKYSLDYAMLLVRNDLGDGHRISLSISL